MGRVYAGEDLLLGGRIAIKVIRAELARQPRALERFRREIRLARRITHRSVCKLFDLAIHRTANGELPVLTMELLEGETLAARIARGRLAVAEALPIATQLAAALAAAHDAGIVHRDLTSPTGMLEAERVVITDFGLATLTAPAATLSPGRVTTEGGFIGTPAYMAPEQVTGGELTPAVDIYALGVLLYEMVTGVLPFGGDTPLAIAAGRVAGTAPAARTYTPE